MRMEITLILMSFSMPIVWLLAFYTGIKWGKLMSKGIVPTHPLNSVKQAVKKTLGPPEKPKNLMFPDLPGGIFEEMAREGYGDEDQFSEEYFYDEPKKPTHKN